MFHPPVDPNRQAMPNSLPTETLKREAASGSQETKTTAGKETSEQHTPKLVVRLTEAINEGIRSVIRYRGELSGTVVEAIHAVDLATVPLVDLENKKLRLTTVTLPAETHKKLKRLAKKRATSMNVMVNTAIAHWLSQKNLLKLL